MEWVLPGRPGEGNLTCFNNGIGRGTIYSSVDEFTPAVDENGNYTLKSGTYAPANFTWTFKGSEKGSQVGLKYSENISGAQRQPNGNTLICSGTIGQFIEVTSDNEIVWEYICPVEKTGRITQGNKPSVDPARPEETMNSVFRVYKYSLDYPAFEGKTLIPGDFIELYSTSDKILTDNESIMIFPNPAHQIINIQSPDNININKILMVNLNGKTDYSVEFKERENQRSVKLNNEIKGIYFMKIITDNEIIVKKIIIE